MSTEGWAVIAAGLIVASGNVLTMAPLWTSPGLGSTEKVAQTLVLWLVPGSFLYVRRVVRTSWAGEYPRGELPNPLLHAGDTRSEVLGPPPDRSDAFYAPINDDASRLGDD